MSAPRPRAGAAAPSKVPAAKLPDAEPTRSTRSAATSSFARAQPGAEPGADVPPSSGPLGNQSLQQMLSGGSAGGLKVSRPDDGRERAADKAADDFVGGGHKLAGGCGTCACTACRAHRHGSGHNSAPAAAAPHRGHGPLRIPGPGQPLADSVRAPFERFFGADLRHVRVHDDAPAQQASRALSANAFAHGGDLFFGRGNFDPESRPGRRLLAHELFHTVDGGADTLHRDPAPAAGTDASATGATAIADAMAAGDLDGVVKPLRNQSVENLKSMRKAVHDKTQLYIERWLVTRERVAGAVGLASKALAVVAAATPGGGTLAAGVAALTGSKVKKVETSAQEGLTLIRPALPLIDRLELHNEAHREIEQAQLDAIKSSSAEERAEAVKEESRLKVILNLMDPKEEYDARLLLQPEDRYGATVILIGRSDTTWDDEDPVFNAIYDLPIDKRRQLWKDANASAKLKKLLSATQLEKIQALCTGSEAEALKARLALATEGRIDDKEGIKDVAKRAAKLLQEETSLKAALASPDLSATDKQKAKDRLEELKGVRDLLKFQYKKDGELDDSTFLGALAAGSGSPDDFGAIARQLAAGVEGIDAQRKFAFDAAKQRILLAAGTLSVEQEAVRNAISEARAPLPLDAAKLPPEERAKRQREENNKLRAELLADDQVKAIVKRIREDGPTGKLHALSIERLAQATEYDELLYEFASAITGGRDGEVFKIALVISKHPAYVAELKKNAGRAIGALDAYSRLQGKTRTVVDKIFETQKIPIEGVLDATSNVEALRTALAEIDEPTRVQLRLGYYLERNPAIRQAGIDTDQLAALTAFRNFEAQLKKSQTTAKVAFDAAGFQAVLDAVLGSDPPAAELKTPEGMFRAASIMHARITERLALGRGASAYFTETDETMVAAGQEFEALWLQLQNKINAKDKGKLTVIEFAKLATLFDRFEGRAKEFTAASETASEIAGMVAATAAGVLIVAATGGTATPLVLAAAAAGGALARVGARELFGDDYYSAATEQGARDALLGAIDGALAVLGSALAARGVELVGLGGKTLASAAAKATGEAVEQAAARPFMKKVAAHAVEAAIDGAFSSTISETAGALTDARTWSRGVWQGLLTIGQTAIIAGLTGLATGGLVGAATPLIGRGVRGVGKALFATELEKILDKAGASETLAAARRAATAGDVEETRRLVGAMEKHLSREQAEVLWRELAQGFEGKALGDVAAGTAEHRLVACGSTGGLCLCSPKPCAPLKSVLQGLRDQLSDSAKAQPKIKNALKKAEDAMAAAEAAIPTKKPRVPPPEKIKDVVDALNALSKLGDVEDVALRSLAESINKPRFSECLALEGKTLEQIRNDKKLSALFDEGYSEAPALQRKAGKLEEFPRLKLDADTGTVHIVGDIVLPPRVAIDPKALNSATSLDLFLASKSQAYTSYRDALTKHVVGKPNGGSASLITDQLDALRREASDALAGGGSIFVDDLRHAFHEKTRKAAMDWIFAGADAAGAHARFLTFTKELNPAYLGSFGENFYIRLREIEGTTLIRQPRLNEDNAAIQRRPDIGQLDDTFGTKAGQLGDIKATAVGLEARSEAQIEQMLDAVHKKGGASASFGAGAKTETAKFNTFLLVFLNPQGAYGSITILNRWMKSYPRLTLEIFDKNGVRHLVDVTLWEKLGPAKFEAMVKGWT